MANNTTVILVLAYFVVILIVGYMAGKKTKSMNEFMIAGQSLGVWVTSFGIMAAVMSGWTWLGNPGASYTVGYSAGVKMVALSPFGLVLSYFILAKPVRIISSKFKCYTLPDILAARWGDNRTIRLLSSLIILVGSLTYLVSQWSSMGTALEAAMGVSYKTGVIIGAIIIIAYVAAGGMLASMWTNFIQMIIMFFVAIVLVIKSINAAGGFVAMNLAAAAINPGYVAPLSENITYGFVSIMTYSLLIVGLSYGGQPSLNTKFMMIRHCDQLRWSPLISIVALVVGTSTYIVGIAGIVLVDQGVILAPARADLILMNVISGVFSPAVNAFVMVAVMAAVMSTAESYLFSSAATIVTDLGKHLFGVNLDEKKTLKLTRLAIVAVSIVTVIMALDPPGMISVIGGQAFGTFCAGFGPVLYLGLRWKRVNTKAAIAGMTAGLVIGGVIPIIDMALLDSTLAPGVTIAGIGMLVATTVIIIVSLATKPEHSAVFD